MNRTPPLVLAFAAVALVPVLGACATASPSAATPASAPAADDPTRYCDLVVELDTLGEEVFAGLTEDAPESEFQVRERQFVDRAAPLLDELADAAPLPIRADVETLLDGMRVRAGLPGTSEPGEAEAAEGRVRAFEETACAG